MELTQERVALALGSLYLQILTLQAQVEELTKQLEIAHENAKAPE